MAIETHTRIGAIYNARAIQRRRRTAMSALLAAFLLLISCAAWLLGAPATTYAEDTSAQVTPVGAPGDGKVGLAPTVEAGYAPVGPMGWELEALRDLAEILEWPPVVTQDGTGKLSVQRVISSTSWSSAMIRPFGSPAGAAGAFAAEQEDARLSNYYVIPDTFNSFPAYWSWQNDASGQLIRLRFHWLAGQWIMGVESSGTGLRTAPLRARAEQLLTLALQYGLPTPSVGSTATPSPTSRVVPTATQTAETCGITFSDVPPSLWAYRYINQLACQRVVSGYADGTFRPLNSTSRAQLVKMLVLSEGWPLINPAQPSYRDVGLSHVFYRYIETATARGVISGYGDETFRPDDYVSRAQVAKMIVRSRSWPTRATSTVTLCDVPSSHWARDYIMVAIERGVFTGYGDGCFKPDEPATRAQLAKVVVLSR